MNKERFIALVKNPALLKAEDAPFLEELLQEFPYFQSAHLLAARCYKVVDSIHLQKQIKNAAAHIIDRNVLYNLIENIEPSKGLAHTTTIEEKIEQPNEVHNFVEDIFPATKQVLEQEEVIENIIEQVIQKRPLDTEPSDGLIEMEENDTAEPSNNMEEKVTTNQPNSQEVIVQEIPSAKHVAEIPLEREIILALAESIYVQEFEQNAQEKAENVQKNDDFASEIENSAKNEDEKQIIKEEKENTVQKAATATDFVTWLKELQMSSSSSPNVVEKTSENKPAKESEKLVEAFIDKPMQRSKPVKQEFFSPVNMAKQSVTDNDFFVTETLAKIYIKQGNLTKAIKVYQNLSLKNPEKNTFFAAQIKILKEQLHNKTGK